jgi:hypothetical protein
MRTHYPIALVVLAAGGAFAIAIDVTAVDVAFGSARVDTQFLPLPCWCFRSGVASAVPW